MFKLTLVAALIAVACAGRLRSPPRLDGRIVGGLPTEIQSAPHQVSLQFFGSHYCGGSIVAPTFIVTAAHCTNGRDANDFNIRAGSSMHASGGQLIKVAKIHQHYDFDSWNIDFDISVLELESPIEFNSAAQPIALPKKDQEIAAGSVATVTGWGGLREGGSTPAQLQTVDVDIVAMAQCREDYVGYEITERMLCAGVPQGGKDACQGDSGGPLVVAGELVGIVSWGYGCAREGYPGIYSSVPNLRDFVTKVTGL